MKKTLIILLTVLIIGAGGVGAYFYYTSTQNKATTTEIKKAQPSAEKETTAKETDNNKLPPIESDDKYAKQLALTVEEYADAIYLLSAIVNVDTDTITPETWDEMINTNYGQWKSVNQGASIIYDYLSKDEASILKTAYAQDTFGTDDEKEVQLEGENILVKDTMKIVNETSKDPVLKRIMEKWKLKDSRQAMDMLEYARKDYQKNLNADLNLTATRAYLLSKVRDTSFTTVAAMGLVASGGTLATAGSAGAWGFVEYEAAANLAFNGADMLLEAGENGYIIDNRFGKSLFRRARKLNKIPNTILGFLSLRNMKKKADLASNMITIYGYGDGVRKLMADQKDMGEEQLYNLAIDPNKDYVAVKRDPKALNDYKNPDKVLETLIQLVPPGTYLVDGEPVVVPGLNPENTVNESEIIPTVPEPKQEDLPIGPTIESLRLGDYRAESTIVDKQTGIPSKGVMEFHITEDNEPYGIITYTTDGTANIQMGGGPAVKTTVKGTMTSELTGSFDPQTQTLVLNGSYTANNTSTAQGQTVPTTDTGKITVNGTWNNGAFSGVINVTSNMGFDRTVKWTATKL